MSNTCAPQVMYFLEFGITSILILSGAIIYGTTDRTDTLTSEFFQSLSRYIYYACLLCGCVLARCLVMSPVLLALFFCGGVGHVIIYYDNKLKSRKNTNKQTCLILRTKYGADTEELEDLMLRLSVEAVTISRFEDCLDLKRSEINAKIIEDIDIRKKMQSMVKRTASSLSLKDPKKLNHLIAERRMTYFILINKRCTFLL